MLRDETDDGDGVFLAGVIRETSQVIVQALAGAV